MQQLKKFLKSILLAPMLLVLLFEEWGWEPLARAFTVLRRLPCWAKIEEKIIQLPPWAALLAFCIPALCLVPVKLLALYLLGKGQIALGLSLVIGAKITGTALAARLFQLTQPALMRLRWFARLYVPWKIWKDRMLEQIRNSRPWRLMRYLKRRFSSWALNVRKNLRELLKQS